MSLHPPSNRRPKQSRRSNDIYGVKRVYRIRTRLSQSFMFMGLDDNDMGVVIDAMDERIVYTGENVINEGENGGELYVVEDG